MYLLNNKKNIIHNIFTVKINCIRGIPGTESFCITSVSPHTYEKIEIMKPNGENISATVLRMIDEEGKEMQSCPHPMQVFYVDLGMELDEYDILRRQEEDTAISLE